MPQHIQRAEIAEIYTTLIIITALQANYYFSRTEHIKYAEIPHIYIGPFTENTK